MYGHISYIVHVYEYLYMFIHIYTYSYMKNFLHFMWALQFASSDWRTIWYLMKWIIYLSRNINILIIMDLTKITCGTYSSCISLYSLYISIYIYIYEYILVYIHIYLNFFTIYYLFLQFIFIINIWLMLICNIYINSENSILHHLINIEVMVLHADLIIFRIAFTTHNCI